MITVVTRWETTQMDPALEWRMWRQLKGAFHIDRVFACPMIASMEGYESLTQFSSLSDALSALEDDTQRCFLEPTGYNSLYDLPKDGNIALIVGNTERHNMDHAGVCETFAIKTPMGPNHAHLYGINAAAIALAVRYGQ
jgi:hypothetical protein